jgi:hypothetical protein
MNTTDDFRNVFLNGGISITLIIDVGLAVFLVLFFVLFVRRLALFSGSKKKTLLSDVDKRRKEMIGGATLFGLAMEGSIANMSLKNLREIGDGANVKVTNNLAQFIKDKAKAFWDWLKSLCGGSKNNANKYGRDAATFLYFQQTFLVYAIVLMIITIAVLIPIHVTGNIPIIYESKICEQTVRFDPIQVPLSCLSDPVADANLNIACSDSGTCNSNAACVCESGSTGPYCQFRSCGASQCSLIGSCGSQQVGACPCVRKL